ncbi:MAG: pyrroline-5-carboxylate reductase [Rhizobiaceae bacterium]
MSKSVILAGCGNMGFAMLKGWIDGGVLEPGHVTVVEPSEALRVRAHGLGVRAVADTGELNPSHAPTLVVIAVKPQMMGVVLPSYAAMAARGTAFLSVAAGTPMKAYEAALGASTPIVRCMPNTPAAIGKGMLVYFNNANVSEALDLFVRELLACSGLVAKIDTESLMDAVTAVSGSGPAYVFHFIECLTQAGIDAGLPSEIAAMLAMQTVMGAGALAAASEETPGKLRENVTSPNGTTQAGLNILMGNGALQKLVSETVNAARKRSVELGS